MVRSTTVLRLWPKRVEWISSDNGISQLLFSCVSPSRCSYSFVYFTHPLPHPTNQQINSAYSRLSVKEACGPGYRSCDSRECIQSHRFCDGTADCLDGSDELPNKCSKSSDCRDWFYSVPSCHVAQPSTHPPTHFQSSASPMSFAVRCTTARNPIATATFSSGIATERMIVEMDSMRPIAHVSTNYQQRRSLAEMLFVYCLQMNRAILNNLGSNFQSLCLVFRS